MSPAANRHRAALPLSLLGAAAIAIAPAASASDKPSAKQRAAVLQAVVDCRPLTDPAARLKCYDDAAARLDQAEATGQVVVVDREQARQVRKEVFGLQLPSLDIFSHKSGGGVAEIAKGEDVDSITSTIKQVSQATDGKWIMVLDTGAVWRQIDTIVLERDPRPGSKAEVRRASLGSYFMKVDGQHSIRVHRDR